MDVRRQGVALLLLAACLLLMGGCRRPPPDPAGERQVLRYVNYSPLGPLDPDRMTSSAQYTVACHVLEGLMRVYQDTLRYGMAERYEISEDGRMYRFFLRTDGAYSDGTPVTAADFLRTFRRLVREDGQIGRLTMLENAVRVWEGTAEPEELGVWAEDDHTLCFRLEEPAPHFLQLLALPMYAPSRSDRGDTLTARDCNGPFTLTENGDTVTAMERNPCYWDGASIRLDRVEAVCFPSAEEAYAAFQRGEIHVMPLPSEGSEAYTGGVQRTVETGICEYITLYQGADSPLRSQALRQALNYALDRQRYVEELGSDLIEPWARCVLPSIPGMRLSYGQEFPHTLYPLKGDRGKAEACLTQALAQLSLDDPADICLLLAVHDDPWTRLEGEKLQAQWEETLGITVELVPTQTYDDWPLRPGAGRMALLGEIAEYGDPLVYLDGWAPWVAADSPFHRCLSQAAAQSDRLIRLNCLFEAESCLLEEAPMIPLQIRSERLLLSRRVEGFQTSATLVGGGYEFLYGYLT